MQMRWTSPAWLCSQVQRGRVLRPTDGTGVRVWMRGARVVQVLQSRRALPPRPHPPAPAVGPGCRPPGPAPSTAAPGVWRGVSEQPGRNSRLGTRLGWRHSWGTLPWEAGAATSSAGAEAAEPAMSTACDQSSGGSSAASLLCESRGHCSPGRGPAGETCPESPRPSGSAGVDVAPLRGATAEPRGRSFRLRVFT